MTVSCMYIWSENSSSKSEAKDAWMQRCMASALSIVFVCAVFKECTNISYFDIDLKNNTLVLWTDNFELKTRINWEKWY